MAAMLSKAAHVINLLALVPVAFLAYIAWITQHPRQYPVPPGFISIKNIEVALGLFAGLYLISVLLGLIALLRGSGRPADVKSS